MMRQRRRISGRRQTGEHGLARRCPQRKPSAAVFALAMAEAVFVCLTCAPQTAAARQSAAGAGVAATEGGGAGTGGRTVGSAEEKAVPPFAVRTADGKTSITIDTSAAPELQEWARTKLAPVLALWYPRIDGLLASDGFVAPTHVAITFKPEPGVAETLGTEVSGNSQWFRGQLDGEAVGAMVHELVHVVQQYGDREPESFPGWLTEGIADYIRFFKFEPDYHGADDVWLARQDPAKVRFDGAYRLSANFLDWVTRKYDPQIVEKLNAAARRGVYSEGIWREKSGKTVVELGNEWKEEKAQLLKGAGAAMGQR